MSGHRPVTLSHVPSDTAVTIEITLAVVSGFRLSGALMREMSMTTHGEEPSHRSRMQYVDSKRTHGGLFR